MPDSIQPIPATKGLSPAELVAQQQTIQQQNQVQSDLDQQKAQKAAEKGVFRRIYNKTIQKGSLIAFRYTFYKHDFSPLVLVGKLNDWNQPGMIAGLNLHYLTFRYMKYLTTAFCGKNFSYQQIKGNQYIVNAYRSYKKEGRKSVQTLDCNFLNGVLKTARSFKPNELEAIRQNIQKQLKDKMHQSPEDFAQKYQQMVFDKSHKDYNTGKAYPHGNENPKIE